MENVNDNNYGNIVKIQKYQCWKCEGEGGQEIGEDDDGIIIQECDFCDDKGYIPLIPYKS